MPLILSKWRRKRPPHLTLMMYHSNPSNLSRLAPLQEYHTYYIPKFGMFHVGNFEYVN